MKKLFLALLLALPLCAAAQDYVYNPPNPAQMAAAAPVQSVNGNTGAVTVPTYQRQVSSALTVNTSDGTVTWNFPVAFTNQPTCFEQLAASSTTVTFDAPLVTASSTSSVSYLLTSHPKTLQILVLTLPITLTLTSAGVPSGTTLSISCIAPLP